MTSKEVPQLSYINLRLIQYPYGISIDQKYHIQYTILAKWHPDSYDEFDSGPTPFKAYSTFEIYISENLSDTPAEPHLL